MTEGRGNIDLGAQLDITVASTLKQQLSGALASEQPVELDGNSLQRVDTAGVQMLLAFSRAAAEGPGWGWKSAVMPEKVGTVARALGVEDELHGDSV